MASFSVTDITSDNPDDRGDFSKMMSMFGPGHVDQVLRQAIQMCWMSLPADKKTPDEVETTIWRIMDRTIQNFREDCETFKKP